MVSKRNCYRVSTPSQIKKKNLLSRSVFGFSVFKYDSLLLTMEHRSGYIFKGYFKLVHKINLDEFINWIGSAWKWIAGSADAIDWGLILKSQKEIIITNNNNQYIINDQILNITRSSIDKVNEIVMYINEISKCVNSENLEILASNKLLVLKEQIS